MKTLLLLLFFSLSPKLFAETKPVPYVDLSRYIGTWYEIASIPQKFAKGCHCTRAIYSLKKDKKINVLNTCNRGSVTGELTQAKGRAKVVDKETNAKLKVSFFWPFYGDYWIIGLEQNYQYAVISNKEGSTLWILSRTPELSDTEYQEAVNIAKSQGVDVSKLVKMEQLGCTYPQG